MRSIAFLTMDDRAGFCTSDQLAAATLEALGYNVVELSWRQPRVHWDSFRAVIIRSTWDYQKDVPLFLHVLSEIDRSGAVLINNLDVVRWNIRKTYLRDLQARGVPIVPTIWMDSIDERRLRSVHDQLACDELVIKPTVGANADDTFRLTRDGVREFSRITMAAVFGNRACMAQPFVSGVIEAGEFSLFYFSGQYSHAIVKTPAPGDFRVQEEHGGQIRAVQPSLHYCKAAGRALAAVPFETVYARVDLVPGEQNEPLLMELELIEPSLYFSFDAEAAKRFATAVDDSLRSSRDA